MVYHSTVMQEHYVCTTGTCAMQHLKTSIWVFAYLFMASGEVCMLYFFIKRHESWAGWGKIQNRKIGSLFIHELEFELEIFCFSVHNAYTPSNLKNLLNHTQDFVLTIFLVNNKHWNSKFKILLICLFLQWIWMAMTWLQCYI